MPHAQSFDKYSFSERMNEVENSKRKTPPYHHLTHCKSLTYLAQDRELQK